MYNIKVDDLGLYWWIFLKVWKVVQDEDIREGPRVCSDYGRCKNDICQWLCAVQQRVCEINGGCCWEEELALYVRQQPQKDPTSSLRPLFHEFLVQLRAQVRQHVVPETEKTRTRKQKLHGARLQYEGNAYNWIQIIITVCFLLLLFVMGLDLVN